MAESPPPVDSSLNAPNVGSPTTMMERLRLRDQTEENGKEDDFDNKSVSSAQYSQTSEATTAVKQQPFLHTMTKVYCHIDDETDPYMLEVHVPPDLITLGDLKRVLMRTNFKYYRKALDPDSGYEVKAEIRDDSQRLTPSPNNLFELFLLTIEGSTHSDGSSGKMRKYPSVPGPAPSNRNGPPMNYQHAAYQFDNSMMSTDSESMISAAIPGYLKSAAYNRRFPQHYLGHRRHLEESTIGSESDARVFSDDDDRGSTTTDFTSVSRQHEKMAKKKKNKRNFRKPSRASSFSSITESSMSLDVITVNLNMDTVNFLGISIVGQTSNCGDNGIYVANIMKGGAVALDGRIEAGDMILQVNETSFENFTNDQAVDVLREAVSRRGPIKLTVAKSFENGQSCFTIPRNSREEPVRPIDTQAWIQHTNAMRGMPSIVEESAPTPIPGEWPHGRPPSSSTVTSNGSNGQNTVVGGGAHIILDIHTDKKKVVEIMAMPGSGLDIKNRTWLKIPIPMSFLGSDLVEWLLDHVEGLRERKTARNFAADLLKLKYIAHVVNKVTFTEQCYYVLGDECSDYARFRNEDGGPKYQWTIGMNGMSAGNGSSVMLPPPHLPGGMAGPPGAFKGMAPSMVSDGESRMYVMHI
ncbi:DiSHevelled related [Caenorhabditis elegans]|uniref:DiSHevelled related n=2 Tax=Caenorhabditis elegans TaxID=6239 RepID=B7WN58_CAEEL|nr:DiSHevelled related [Caenorhabditis elegans]CCD65829.1 DiSHevelled related [Caenorhabditis elegans]|eukprot:NP_494979.5 DiSHevelled related [Caenorhabditis elegans]